MKMERNKIYYVMVNGELMKFTFDESKTREEFENFLKEKNITAEKIYDSIVNKNFDK
jgi:hypothetical protein